MIGSQLDFHGSRPTSNLQIVTRYLQTAMAVNYKNPPKMREDLLYADWKTELEIWQSFTDLAKAKQGPAVFLSLKGKACQTALAEVKPADLAKDTSVDTILNTLD